jgi:hypothetical protein
MARKTVMLILTLLLVFAGIASAGNVSSYRARKVAENLLSHVVRSYGSWGGIAVAPVISGEESFVHNGVVVGYNFTVDPRGHILVSARDDIPAVKLYSETTTLSLQDEGLQEQIDWISKEIFDVGEAIDIHSLEMVAADPSRNPDRKVWAIMDKDTRDFATAAGEAATEATVSYGPLLTTTWAQGDPYNQECPTTYIGQPTLVGCVATAASQIMRYWNYPAVGQGSTSYSWYNGLTDVQLSRNFADSTYDWFNMPDSVSSASTTAQKNAVSKLCADVGIAFQMDYGTRASGAVTSAAPDVFINYFNYQNTAHWVDRSSYANASAWMQVFKAEVQAGRPSQLRIRDPNEGGHSVVVDGYRDSPSEMVHINMGWGGAADFWYTPDSFITSPYSWTDTYYQGAAIGIQPPGISGLWRWEGTAWTQLGAANPENMVISGTTLYADYEASYGLQRWDGSAWTQIAKADPENMVVSGTTLYADFGASYGLQRWDGSAWTQIAKADPENMVVSGTTLFADFGASYGLWMYDGISWTQLGKADPENMVVSGTKLYADYGASYGLQRWDGSAWTQIAKADPENMMVSGTTLYVDYGASYGLWMYDSISWTQLGKADPENMVVSGTTLYVDYGASYGLWRWDGTAWTQLSPANPKNMVVSVTTLYVGF